MLTAISLVVLASITASPVDDAARKAFAPLPGTVGFAFTELTADGPKLLSGVNENERFAVGSTFKLFILGTLVDDVNAGRRKFDDVARLKAEWHGPPSSEMAEWPVGSPVTLHTLALKMIWISDNTATDHMLHLLGREAIEKQMAAMGHSHPAWNTPLLSTREMTMLRDKKTGKPGLKYLKLDDAARRKFLADHFASAPDYEKLDFDAAAYNVAEWYATPMDMARALAWLKTHTAESSPAFPTRGILAVDTKLPHDAKIWPYVGFKGGSEDQLICGNWLLQHHSGRWFTLHVYCNSPKENVAPEPFLKAVETVFAAIQKDVE